MKTVLTHAPGNMELSSDASLLVFSDDWGRHPSSCQHLISRLLHNHPVWWVNTIGMRPPTFDLSTVTRGFEKIRHWSGKRKAVSLPENLHLVNPTMWPWFRRSRDRFINKRLLLRCLKPLVESMPKPIIAVTTIPIVADLIGPLPVDRWVYYCVDDFGEWPGLDNAAMSQMEQTVVERADLLISVSDNLQTRLDEMGRSSTLLTHGVDLSHWKAMAATPPACAELAGLETPLVVFWGVIDRRMDVEFVRLLSSRVSRGSIVLVGPVDNPDPRLFKLPRVVHLPPLAYSQLPLVAASASVLVMPYQDLPVTRAMQPLKLKEYLATGKPAVARDLPANRPWADAMDLVATAEEFADVVMERIASGNLPSQMAARIRLEQEGWEEKARYFATMLRGVQPSVLNGETSNAV